MEINIINPHFAACQHPQVALVQERLHAFSTLRTASPKVVANVLCENGKNATIVENRGERRGIATQSPPTSINTHNNARHPMQMRRSTVTARGVMPVVEQVKTGRRLCSIEFRTSLTSKVGTP